MLLLFCMLLRRCPRGSRVIDRLIGDTCIPPSLGPTRARHSSSLIPLPSRAPFSPSLPLFNLPGFRAE